MKFESYKLSELVQIIGGGTPKRKVEIYWNGDIPWLSVKDFNDKKRWVHQTDETITEKGLNESSTKLLKTGDLIISARGTVGEIAQLAKPMAFNQSCYGLRAHELLTTNDYLYYWIRYNVNYVKNNTHGSVFDTITRNTFDNLIVKLPPKEYQNKVVKVLTMIDKKIELNNAIISNLEELAQTLFKRWFVDFEFPNEEGKPYKSSGGKMVESELGMIPEGWEIQKIEQQSKIVRGGSPRPIKDYVQDKGIPWVKISDANASTTMYLQQTNEFIKEEGKNKSREVFPGTLILSNSATPGIPMIMNIYACVHDGWLIFDEFEDISKEYMYQFLKYERKNILTLSNGSVFRNLKTSILKKYPIIVPESNVLKDFQEIIENIQSKILNIDLECIKLKSLRDTLLPKLLSGEIELPDDMEVTDDVPIS